MVKDSIEGNAVDVLPLTSANGEALALVIPGSSVKGAMRF
jgi:CRISPR/Cas system CSM-associated protein Csm3 (group 7 of RAMP superfamily)